MLLVVAVATTVVELVHTVVLVVDLVMLDHLDFQAL